MSKQVLLMSILTICISFSIPVSDSIAVESQLLDQAENLAEEGQIDQAILEYQAIIQSQGDIDVELTAAGRLTELYIISNQGAKAQAEYEKIISNYANNELVTEVVAKIANTYRKSGKYDNAKQAYQYNITNSTDVSQAVEACCGMGLSAVWIDDEKTVIAAVDKIISDYSVEDDAGRSVYNIINESCKKENMELAERVCERSLIGISSGDQRMWLLGGQALKKFYEGDDTTAKSEIPVSL